VRRLEILKASTKRRICSSDNNSKEPWRIEGDTDERNEKARKAYQALLTVTARTPDNQEYLNFSREVKSLAQSKYNFTFGNSSVSTFVTAFYDAVLLYALALKESLPEKPGEVDLDGGNLTRRMWGKSFKGKFQHFSLLAFVAYVSESSRQPNPKLAVGPNETETDGDPLRISTRSSFPTSSALAG
jgi:hypothetical protein